MKAFATLLLCALLCASQVRADGHVQDEWTGFAELLGSLPNNAGQQTNTSCDICQLLVGIANATIESNTTMASIEKDLEAACSTLGSSLGPLCSDIVVDIFKAIPKLLVEFHTLIPYDAYGVCAILNQCPVYCCETTRPEQVHLALTGVEGEMNVVWISSQTSTKPTVWYGTSSASSPSGYNMSAFGTSWTYTDGGWHGMIYGANMVSLRANTTYYYRVGDEITGVSDEFKFTTYDGSSTFRLFVVGDMGVVAPYGYKTIANMVEQFQAGAFDFVLHNGDESYSNGYQAIWDEFLRLIEPVAANSPYMVSVGNHELPYNFSSFKNRFVMPGASSGSNTNMFYSWNYGPVHFLAYNAESPYNFAIISQEQIEWIQKDLSRANSERDVRPWIIVYGHRPLYCTNIDFDCTGSAAYIRSQLESIFYENGVDLIFGAHMHNYERVHPVYNSSVVSAGITTTTPWGGISTVYNTPGAPPHIINGAAGNREGIDTAFLNPSPAWSANHFCEFGFGHLTITPATLTWEFFADTDPVHFLDQVIISR